MNFELRNVPLRQVRNDLKVPGVIYGHGIDSTPVMVDDREHFLKHKLQVLNT
jgi:ribosomal protein L25 (general stress protein Ctc)